ncbi:23939_t:CDS:2 [Gigaspora rosea]|nr:23939_t:CDS:2 [Gigaspora rosea]
MCIPHRSKFDNKNDPVFLSVWTRSKTTYSPSQTEEGLEGTILQRTFELVNIVPVIREKAIRNIHQQQIKDKTYHDQKRHLSVGFDIGEKVLLEDIDKRSLLHSRENAQ